MVGAAVLLAGGFLLSSLPRSAVAQGVIVGGYEDVPVSSDATELLIAALGDETNYAADVADRVCVRNVTALSEQVVAGVNYRFEITGSAVENAEAAGWCAEDDDSSAFSYQVTVFEQAWLNSVQVTSIEYLGLAAGASSSGSGSGSWGYGDAGYSSSSFDSSSSASSSGSGSDVNAGDVGYVGDEDDSASASGSVEFDAGSYDSSSASGSADNETISYAGL